MKRFIIGVLAFIGAMSVLFVVGLVGLMVLASASGPTVPSNIVLELDLERPLREHVSGDSLASAFGEDPTTVRDVVDALEKGGRDPRVKSLVARIGNPGSPAQAQELRDAVKAFRATGKKAVAYADTFGEADNTTLAYYVASAFDEVYIQPSGDLNITGISFETPFAREAFAKLGVTPRFHKRAEYKNAINTYTEQGYNAPHREATERYTQSLFGQMVRGIAEERELGEDAVRALIDRAPLLGQDAVDAKLLDGLRYRDEVLGELTKQAGDGAELLYVHKYLERVGRPHATGDTIALVYGVGGVARGKSQGNPLSGEEVMGAENVAAALRKATADSRVKAIIFRVDSPGGSYVASDTVRREVQRAREAGKPVVVTMGTYAASGGYFVAMDADRIVAQPGTLTGSIGVYAGKFVTDSFWEKLGVNFETIAAGKNATMYDSDADFTPEQEVRAEAIMDRIYTDFTQRAAAGRKMPLEKLQSVAKGRAWTGEDALANGLVDALGGYPKALALAKELAKLPADAPVRVEEYPRRKTGSEVLSALLGQTGDNSEDDAASVSVLSPWAPLVAATREVYLLGARLGVFESQRGALYAPMPKGSW
ncbi:signal peptide peptidase SppA [Pyxidicoccus fallax]|uniref:Signal peptide peptidase SppA n=1 Tax=Pyxidicoccus fallax TaxID=394095 RepID=A0A848LNT7_9BACT|nr:signal peptide peptidase SppA [Pyxidicoccus fallax]NMO19361.1 signal peptide peptidase SppA [Pyxidicoccus fallax]NPC86732.1 signal peptide peptidase SppA [Pyxidicoccus fallax]